MIGTELWKGLDGVLREEELPEKALGWCQAQRGGGQRGQRVTWEKEDAEVQEVGRARARRALQAAERIAFRFQCNGKPSELCVRS